MAEKIPTRLRWAVDRLEIAGGEQILEIGCGRGVAVSLVCPRLSSGTITAIDRSPVAIDAARQRNRAWIDAGKAIFRQSSLEDFDAAGGSFDTIFAVNVNLFWLDAERGLAAARKLLAKGGKLFLFYEPPGASRRSDIRMRLLDSLNAGGFEVVDVVEADDGDARLLGVVAHPLP
jgi:cyclopropane fatty-acyl-phospholipid synthase-like methyltransferase